MLSTHLNELIPTQHTSTVAIQVATRNMSRGATENNCQALSLVKHIPEDHWSCIAHLSAEDMLKSAVIEEKKIKNTEFD